MDKELRKKYELPVEKLRYTADANEFKPTNKIEPGLEAIIIGQERAIESIQTGLKLDDKYSNIFVTGSQGLGKDETIRTVLKQYIENLSPEEHTKKVRQRKDLLSAYNFKQPENPLILELPTGWGEKFEKDLNQAVNYILKDGIKVYEKQFEMDFLLDNSQLGKLSKQLKEQQEKLQKESQKIQAEINKLEKQLQETQPESKEAEEYNKKIEKLSQEYSEMDNDSLEKETKIQAEMTALQSQNMSGQKGASKNYKDTTVKPELDKLKQKYPTNKIKNYLERLEEAIMHDVKTELSVAQMSVGAKMGGNMMQMQMPPPPDMSPYQIKRLNELKPEEQINGIPVIFEKKPTLESMFGTVEASKYMLSPMGMEKPKKDQHLRLEAGSFMKSLGGYFIVSMMKMAQKDLAAFERLIEDLDAGKTNIENARLRYYVPTISEDVKSNVKVIINGNNGVYQQLKHLSKQEYFEEFNKTFGIKSEFDTVAENNKGNREQYSKYVARLCKRKGLKNVTPEGIAEIIEYASRITDRQDKLTLELSELSSIIREANLKAKDGKEITAEHIKKAIESKQNRHNLVKSKIEDFITDGTKIIDTKKEIIGDVNALVVYTLEDSSFGAPAKLTATTSVGSQGVISLDVEAGSAGEIFKKAVFTLKKNLERLFAQDKIISLNGGVSLEQSYGGIEGDSATLASFLALISELSGCSVDQEIAVTGSMNQKGLVQPIGGANEKIEGFYQICKARGLTGNQGVIVPKLNEKDLMLSDEIVDSVKTGKFHIYSTNKPEEAIEIIMGNKACDHDTNGNRVFTEGTVYEKVDKKIISYNNVVKTKSDKE